MARFPDGRDDETDETAGERGLLGRRSFLKTAAGAAAAAAVGAANSGAVRAAQDEVNVVDAGADDTGGEPINDVLKSNLSDGTRFVFPSGTYRLDPIRWTGYDNLTLVAPDGARLVPPSGIGTSNWMYFEEVSNFRFEGFTLDNTEDSAAPAHLFNATGGVNVIKDVTVEGFRPEKRHCIMPWCEGEETMLTLDNVRLPDGNYDGAAMYIPEQYLYNTDQGPGILRFHDMYVENFSQGIYASGHGGPIEFVGGEYANNGIDGIRLGGGNTRQALVSGVTIRVDGPADPIEHKPNMRGIWLREGEGTVVEDCEVIMTDFNGSYSAGGIVIEQKHGDCTIRNTRIKVDEDVPAIKARVPNWDGAQGMDSEPDNWDVNLENVSITGSDSGDEAVRIYGRDGSTVTNCCIHQTGSDRDGVHFLNSSGCAVADSTINVTGQAVKLTSSSADTTNVAQDGTCPVPDPDAGSDGGSRFETDMPHTIWVSGDGQTTQYEFEVSGAVEKTIVDGSTVNDYDSIDGTTVTGLTTNEADAYGFEGEIVSFSSDASPVVKIDGEQVDPSTLGSSDSGSTDGSSTDGSDGSTDSTSDSTDGTTDSTSDSSGSTDGSDSSTDDSGSSSDGSTDGSSLDRTLWISGGGETCFYDFEVTGELEKATLNDATVNDYDSIDGSSVTGVTTNEGDAFRFSGDIVSFSADGNPTVEVDGEQVDVGNVVDTRTLWISGGGQTCFYEFEVSGSAEKSTANDATINDYDSIDGAVISGVTTNQADAYEFTGDVVSFSADADPTVEIDGEQVDPSTLGSSDSAGGSSDGSTSDGSTDGSSTDGSSDGSTSDGSTDGSTSDGSTDGSSTEPLPNLVVIDGADDGQNAGYSLTVTGGLEAAPDAGELEDDDAVQDLVADGAVGSDLDAYRFSGDVDSFQLSGVASVTFEESSN